MAIRKPPGLELPSPRELFTFQAAPHRAPPGLKLLLPPPPPPPPPPPGLELPAPPGLELSVPLVPPPPPRPEGDSSGAYSPGNLLRRIAGETVVTLPSRGSVGHACGRCRPCDYFHKDRCKAGADCEFCHLCGPNAMKEHRKAKKAMKRALRRFE